MLQMPELIREWKDVWPFLTILSGCTFRVLTGGLGWKKELDKVAEIVSSLVRRERSREKPYLGMYYKLYIKPNIPQGATALLLYQMQCVIPDVSANGALRAMISTVLYVGA